MNKVKQPISLNAAIDKYNLSRATIDRKCKEGVFTKYSLPGSSKVFLDEAQVIDSFQIKEKTPA